MSAKLLTIKEAAFALGISRSTLWRRLKRGDLPSIRSGGRRLVRVTPLQAARENIRGSHPAFSESHPIFRLAGAGRSGGQPPGARNKHAILDE